MADIKWEDTSPIEQQSVKWEDTSPIENNEKKPGRLGAAVNAFAAGGIQGVTAGYADEIEAAVSSPFTLASKEGVGALIPTNVSEARELVSKLRGEYKKNKVEALKAYKEASSYSPIAGTFGEITGAIASPIGKIGMGVKAIKAAGISKQALKPLLKTVAGSGLQGAAYGLGTTEKDLIDTMSEGTASERQELKNEVLVPTAIGLTLPGVLGGTAYGLKKGFNAIAKLRGETPLDALQKSLIKVTGANPSEANALERTSEGVADTLQEYSIIKNMGTSKRGMFNNVTDVLNNKVIPALKNIYRELGKHTKVSSAEIAQRALRKSYNLNPNTELKLIKKIEKEANDLAQQDDKIVEYAWQTRKDFDKAAFTHAKSMEPGSSLNSQYSAIMRDAYQDTINDATLRTLGGDIFNQMRKLSNDSSNLLKIGSILKDSKNRLGMSLVDRLTIGAVYAGLANPVIGGSFFLGRELGRGVGPRTRFVEPGRPLTPTFARGMYGATSSQYNDQE